MCGIVGLFLLNKTDLTVDPGVRRAAALFLHNEVLYHTVERGKHATGVGICLGNPENLTEGEAADPLLWVVLKQPAETADFFDNDGSAPRYKGQDPVANAHVVLRGAATAKRPLKHIIGHCRQKTLGSEHNPLNNHPILVGNIVGIHNGKVDNYKDIYKLHEKMTPQGEVDSEAIFQLLAENANDRPLGAEDIAFSTGRIDGKYAVIAYNREHPDQVIFFRNTHRPLELAYLEELGFLFICSERKFLDRAMRAYTRLRLSARIDLPPISAEWKNIWHDEGGVIDITAPFSSAESGLTAALSIVKTKDPLAAYKEGAATRPAPTNTAGSASAYKYGQNPSAASSAGHGIGFRPNQGELTEVIDLSDPDEVRGTGQPGGGKVHYVEEGKIVPENTAPGPGDENDEIRQRPTVDAQCFPAKRLEDLADEEGEDAEEGEEEDFAGAAGYFSHEEKRTKAEEYWLGEEFQKDNTTLLSRHKEDLRALVPIQGVTRDEAEEVVHGIYVEAFSDGFIAGFNVGSEETEELADEETAADDDNAKLDAELSRLEMSNERLHNELIKVRGSVHKAGAIMANLKWFLVSTLIASGGVRVDKERLVFNKGILETIRSLPGFSAVKPGMVEQMFTKKDVGFIERLLENRGRSTEGIVGRVWSAAQKTS